MFTCSIRDLPLLLINVYALVYANVYTHAYMSETLGRRFSFVALCIYESRIGRYFIAYLRGAFRGRQAYQRD